MRHLRIFIMIAAGGWLLQTGVAACFDQGDGALSIKTVNHLLVYAYVFGFVWAGLYIRLNETRE